MSTKFYVTTPVYYVNDVPHLGHIYSTLIADIASRSARVEGKRTYFLTGTDEHSTKVSEAAQRNSLGTHEWASKNAAAFKATFDAFNFSYSDFIRTSQERHKKEVELRIQQLIDSGAVYLGEYKGWYDAGQEEYVTAAKAKAANYLSPISGKPLVERSEENYFFCLSQFQDELLHLVESEKISIIPQSRRNEIISKIKEGLNDIPISRISSDSWGIRMPKNETHLVYVWIDALLNYVTAINTDALREFWPPSVQVVGKDIIWFHAVIWPAMLLALQKCDGNEWLQLPEKILAHGFWTHEGIKMSKSLGNFVSTSDLEGYNELLGLDAVRLFLIMNGPLGGSDSSFSERELHESYNANLANTVGNCFGRVTTMIGKYFDGCIPTCQSLHHQEFSDRVNELSKQAWLESNDLAFDKMAAKAIAIFREIDGFIHRTAPYKLIKEEHNRDDVAEILYRALDAIRLGAIALLPIMPNKMQELLSCLQIDSPFEKESPSMELVMEQKIELGRVLFPRFDTKGS